MLYVNPLENRSVAVPAAADKAQKEKMALRELEHFFLYTLMKEMRKTTDVGNQKSHEQGLYEDMQDDALAGIMASSGQVGLAKQIELQMQSSTSNTHTQLQPTLKQMKAYADNNYGRTAAA